MRLALVGFLLLALVFSNTVVYGQYKRKTERLAHQLYEQKDYYNAAIFFRKLMLLDSSKADVNYYYAQSLRGTNDYTRALHYYLIVYKKDRGKQFPDAIFWIGEMYKREQNYTKAKKYFKRAERYYRGRKSTYFYAKVKQEQLACDLAARLIKQPTPGTVVNNIGMPVNSVNAEFAGHFMNNTTLYFSSLRPEEDSLGEVQYRVRLYESKKDSINWHLSTNDALQELNANEYHTANGVFNATRNRFFFSFCSDSGRCELYESRYYEQRWGSPKTLGKKINLEGYSATQPAVGRINGEDVLFFVSDRPDGFGQSDIWYATAYSNGVFSQPQNAGKHVNTLGNDITPFYHSTSQTLLYSSDWHQGLGGFDVFKSEGLPGAFTPSENLGYPINSSADDIYFSIFETTAILTSNRKGSFSDKSATCCNDLYVLNFQLEEKKVEDPVQEAYDELAQYLPMRLFFHNDEPNPRSKATITDENYMLTYERYVDLMDRYKREYSKGLRGEEKEEAEDEIADFFDLEVKDNAENLMKFAVVLQEELERGRKIELTLKGFASPLSKSDYNSNLTLRRISSIANFFKEFNEGKLSVFLDSGQLSIRHEPYGEDQSASDVSDNLNDKRNSIYSKRAAFERRVEVISLNVN
jgi:tetratricopeptide (TPR) repeat protein